jgi:putative membrane protein
MPKLAKIMIAIVAILHLYIAWFGIFAWQGQGPATFPDLPASLFEPTTAMAANQGVYNLCLAAGLIWSLLIRDIEWQRTVATAFMLFVATAGLFGAWRVSTDIALVQAGPAVIGLILLWLPGRKMRKQ